MAKLKLLKRPKAPKASASVTTKENYLKKLEAVKRENARRAAVNRKSEDLTKRIQKAIQGFK